MDSSKHPPQRKSHRARNAAIGATVAAFLALFFGLVRAGILDSGAGQNDVLALIGLPICGVLALGLTVVACLGDD